MLTLRLTGRDWPKPCATIVALGMLLLVQGSSLAEESGFPGSIAFNSGYFEKAVVDDAVSRGVAEHSSPRTGEHIIRHLRIEVFENSREAATAQTVVFALCESTFHSALPSG